MAKKKCEVADLYDSLEFCPGETSLPGLRNEAYFVSRHQITTYPKLPAVTDDGVSMSSLATYKGDFSLAADAVFHKMDILDSKSNNISSSQGEKPSKSFINTITLKYAGNNEAAAGFCRLANVDDLLFIVRQRDGAYRVIGNEMFATDVKPSQDSGMQVTDESGTTIEASVTDVAPAPYYKGHIKTADGIIDCATGEITAE